MLLTALYWGTWFILAMGVAGGLLCSVGIYERHVGKTTIGALTVSTAFSCEVIAAIILKLVY